MEYKVSFIKNGQADTVMVRPGTNLLEVMREKGLQVSAPCGGKGTCGKCHVKINSPVAAPTSNDVKLLGREMLQKGYRLACQYPVMSDLEVAAEDRNAGAVIMTEGTSRNIALKPLVQKLYVELEIPELGNQMADLERLSLKAGLKGGTDSPALLRELPALLRSCDFKCTAVTWNEQLLAIEPGDTSSRHYGVAVDIGTTTIAAYLYDLSEGKQVDVCSMLNPQSKFGADVLSRIEYTMADASNLKEMQSVIIECINGIVSTFTLNKGLDRKDIYQAVFAGNTTMMHFLMGLDASNIARSPFIPATTGMHDFNAGELGLDINPAGRAVAISSVSGYIGADTVAAALSSGMYEDERISLLIDIGTNGEIVLGCKDWLYACSTAAGPAFEGANIRNGVGGITGAIDRVKLIPSPSYTVIGGGKPIGLCGSGIVDAIAQMLLASVIDDTGRIADEEEEESLNEELKGRFTEINNQRAFQLVSIEESGCDTDIAITQRDVRELQNAKAAIAAGIKTLAKRAGVGPGEITKVYLAGGFGSYIDVESAIAIGLLPKELDGRVESIGNAAGAGAVESLLSAEMLETSEYIAKRIHYVELSASADFTEEYVECMMF